MAADEYDRHRPRYPRPLVAGLITCRDVQVLDVGAGTGIASAQLAEAGAHVMFSDAGGADYLDVTARSIVNAEDEVTALIEECGFSIERRRCVERLHYVGEDYLNLLSTYSNRLLLDPTAQAELRTRLAQRIATTGVDAHNDALAVVCTPASAR